MEKTDKDLKRLEEECNPNEYILLYMPKHPTANKAGYVPQHRYVVECDLGRYLLPTEVVHHIDLDKTNNSRDNLLLFNTQGDHIRFHNYNYTSEDVKKLIEEKLIIENVNHAFVTTTTVNKYKCICKFCGDTFSSETKHNNFCSRICFRNAQLGNELPEKEQLLDWLNRGYSKYKIIQMLEVTESTLDAYFSHYDINYKKYKQRNKNASRDLPLERYDKLSGLKINIRDKDLNIAGYLIGMENFIDWLINNRYTTTPNTKDGRDIIRSRVYQGLYKKRITVFNGLIIDSPNLIHQLKKLKNVQNMEFGTQEQYNKWIEMFYLIHHSKEIKIERYTKEVEENKKKERGD